MKKLPPLLIICLLGGCGNNQQSSAPENKTDPSTTPGGSIAVTKDKSGPNTLWIGEPAQWQKAPGNNIDGKYDSAIRVFIACGDTNGSEVDPGFIKYIPGVDCEQIPGRQLRVLEYYKKNDSQFFKVIPSAVRLTDTSKEIRQGSIEVNSKKTPVIFDRPSMERIKSNPALLKSMMEKK
jgi:hypothetical protein